MPERTRLPYHSRVEAYRGLETLIVAGHPRDAWPIAKSFEEFRPALLLTSENDQFPDPETLRLPKTGAQSVLVNDLAPLDMDYRVRLAMEFAKTGALRVRFLSPDGTLQRIGEA